MFGDLIGISQGTSLLRAIVVGLGLTASVGAWAQAPGAYAPPRLADGHPDLQGVWGNSPIATPLETNPALGDKPVVSQAEARALADTFLANARKIAALQVDLPDQMDLAVVRGEHRTRLIVEPANGRIPFSVSARKAVSDWSAQFFRVKNGLVADNPESLALSDRCISLGGQPPMHPSLARQIVQSPGYIVIHMEGYNETRVVRMNGVHQPNAIRTRLGDSVGRWVGDVLVVETTAFRLDEPYYVSMAPNQNPPFVVGPTSKVVERFTSVSADELTYAFTIEDPDIYENPWRGEYALSRVSDQRVWESACHEGNHGVANTLAGARMSDTLRTEITAGEPRSKANNAQR